MAAGRRFWRRFVLSGFSVLVVAVVLLIVFWNWDWFLPLVDSRVSATLGRKVTTQHLHVHLGRVTTATLDDVVITEPQGFSSEPPVATVRHFTLAVGVLDYIRGKGLVIPRIDVDGARGDIISRADGSNNYTFKFMQPAKTPPKPSKGPQIGVLSIEDSHIDVAMAKLRAKIGLDVHTTQDPHDAANDRIVVTANGTYAAAPISGRLIAGALLTLRNKSTPYPIDLQVANGATHVSLVGTVENPLKFSGANLRLVLRGANMADLYALTGIPIPTTPPYRVAGQLDYTKTHIVFRNFEGRLGSSDLGGTISVDPAQKPILVDANLHSHEVNLVDLGGFIGAKPGHPAANKAAHAGAAGQPHRANILPTTPISLPRLKAANVDFSYRGDHIEGKFIPLDDIVVDMSIRDGAVDVRKLDFGAGHGTFAAAARLDPAGNGVKANAHMDVRDVDLSHLLNATHVFHGKGIVGGGVRIAGQGSSIADLVDHGNGGVEIYMRDGGDISSLLPDVLGLEITNALLSALGIPQRTNVDCFVAELPLEDGVLSTRLFVLQTGEARTTGRGDIDFRNDTLDYSLTTRSTGFSIGSVPGPIDVSGPISSPSIRPGAEVVARAAGATALGILAGPAAILPTIQFGVGKSSACQAALADTSGPAPSHQAAAAGAGHARKPVHRESRAAIHREWEHRLHGAQ